MVKGTWQSAEFLEAKTFPKLHRGFVCAYDEVELYCLESHFAGEPDTVLAHFSADAFAAGMACYHEGCVCHMVPPSPVVLDDFVESEDFFMRIIIIVGVSFATWFANHHETCDSFAEPVLECVLFGGGFFKIVGVSTFYNIAKYWNHLGKIICVCFADKHSRI